MGITYRIIDSVIISTVALALGLGTLRLNPKKALNRLILLICLCFVVRNTTALLALALFKEREEIVALYKFNFFFHTTLIALILHFFLRLKAGEKLPARAIALVYLPMLALSLLNLFDYQKFIGLVFRDGEWRIALPPRGSRAWTYIFNWMSVLYLAIAMLSGVSALRRAASNRERRQTAVLLAGFSIYFATQAIQPLLPRAISPSVMVYPTFAFIVSLCFATLRYRFLAPSPSPMTEDLIAHISDAVFLLDRNLLVAHANLAAERLISAAPAALNGKPFPALTRGGDEVAPKLKRFQEGAELSLKLRLAFAREGGEPAAAACYLSKVKDRFSDLVGILLIAKELPGRKEFQRLHRITGREMEIVDLVLAGSSNKAIGETLGISERTVEAHCLHVYNKLGARNKAELVRLCAKYDLLE
jgi:DNA-binding CsgD family transcriptional regulator